MVNCEHVWTMLTVMPPKPGPCALCGAQNPKAVTVELVLSELAAVKRERDQADKNLAECVAALEKIRFSRGTDAGSVNANNYTIAREALEKVQR